MYSACIFKSILKFAGWTQIIVFFKVCNNVWKTLSSNYYGTVESIYMLYILCCNFKDQCDMTMWFV